MATQKTNPRSTGVELRFEVQDPGLFFVRASRAADCRVTLAEMVHRSDGRLLEYFVVEGADAEAVRSAAADASAIDRTRIVREASDELLAEFIHSGPCIGATLADTGAVVRTVEATSGVGRAVADVPPHTDASTVAEAVCRQHDADLAARRNRDRAAPGFTNWAFRAALADQLTDRQFEAIRTAYAGGYFSWPRESSAEECASALGITQPTFNEHLRVGQEKLVRALFDADSGDAAPMTGSSPSQDDE